VGQHPVRSTEHRLAPPEHHELAAERFEAGDQRRRQVGSTEPTDQVRGQVQLAGGPDARRGVEVEVGGDLVELVGHLLVTTQLGQQLQAHQVGQPTVRAGRRRGRQCGPDRVDVGQGAVEPTARPVQEQALVADRHPAGEPAGPDPLQLGQAGLGGGAVVGGEGDRGPPAPGVGQVQPGSQPLGDRDQAIDLALRAREVAPRHGDHHATPHRPAPVAHRPQLVGDHQVAVRERPPSVQVGRRRERDRAGEQDLGLDGRGPGRNERGLGRPECGGGGRHGRPPHGVVVGRRGEHAGPEPRVADEIEGLVGEGQRGRVDRVGGAEGPVQHDGVHQHRLGHRAGERLGHHLGGEGLGRGDVTPPPAGIGEGDPEGRPLGRRPALERPIEERRGVHERPAGHRLLAGPAELGDRLLGGDQRSGAEGVVGQHGGRRAARLEGPEGGVVEQAAPAGPLGAEHRPAVRGVDEGVAALDLGQETGLDQLVEGHQHLVGAQRGHQALDHRGLDGLGQHGGRGGDVGHLGPPRGQPAGHQGARRLREVLAHLARRPQRAVRGAGRGHRLHHEQGDPAGHLVDHRGDAAAAIEVVRCRRRFGGGQQLLDVRGPQRFQVDHRGPRLAQLVDEAADRVRRDHLPIPPGQHEVHGGGDGLVQGVLEEPDRGVVGPVQVVDDHHQRPVPRRVRQPGGHPLEQPQDPTLRGLAGLVVLAGEDGQLRSGVHLFEDRDPGPERLEDVLAAPTAHHPCPRRQPGRQRAEQGGLADALLAYHRHPGTGAGLDDAVEAGLEPGQLPLPSDHRARHRPGRCRRCGWTGRAGRRRGGRRHDRRGHRRHPGRPRRTRQVLVEHVALDPLEGGAGFEAQPADQVSPSAGVGVQGLGLATAAVERGHQELPPALPQRVVLDQGLQVGDDPLVASEVQLDRHAVVDRLVAQRRQPGDGSGRERQVGDVGQGRAPPPPVRGAEVVERVLQAAPGPGLGRRVQRPLEPVHVAGAAGVGHEVARRAGVHGVRAQRGPEVRDVDVDRLDRGGRRVIGPQAVGQRVDRHHPTRGQQQLGQQPTALGTAERQGVAIGVDRHDGTQQAIPRFVPRLGLTHRSSSSGRGVYRTPTAR